MNNNNQIGNNIINENLINRDNYLVYELIFYYRSTLCENVIYICEECRENQIIFII